MGKKVLLICNHFAPDNTIAAVRLTKIAKYLVNNGYQTEVLKEAKRDGLQDEILQKDAKGIRIYEIQHSVRYQKFHEWYVNLIRPFKEKRFQDLKNRYRMNPETGKKEFYPFETAYPLFGSLDYLEGLLGQYDLFCGAKIMLRKRCGFDYIITSYGDAFAFFAGKYFHKYHKEVFWVFDIRDAVCRYKFTPRPVAVIAKRIEKYIWKYADSVIGVSKGICKRVPYSYRHKVHCITNGYDWSDRDNLSQERLEPFKLTFTYTGSMYGGLQDLTVFFRCIKDAVRQGAICEKKIAFHYAGNETAYEIFKGQAEKFRLGECCVAHGRLERKDSLQLQQRSDVLILAAADYQSNEGGIITGKLLEYMSAQKPVIAIICGDIVHSEMAEIIRNTKLGFAYEEAHKKTDYMGLYQYICGLYAEFEKMGRIAHFPDKKELKKYDYRYLCKRFIQILDRGGRS